MTINQMRTFVSKAYPGDGWISRVKRMPDNQIIAIYYNLLNRKEAAITFNDNEDLGMKVKQLSLFDDIFN